MIDTTPQVGRYVLRISDSPHHWIDLDWIGKIIAINGKQLTFERRWKGFNDPSTEERKMLQWKIAAVCDTEDEVRNLIEANRIVQGLYEQYLNGRASVVIGMMGEQK